MHPPNPKESEALAKVAHEVAQRSSKILGEFVQKQAESMSSAVRDEMGIAKAFMDLYARMAADPALKYCDDARARLNALPILAVAEPAVAPPLAVRSLPLPVASVRSSPWKTHR